ncbi:MAG: hypothetical protein U0R78_04120 [Nocardioidaceae bacterium]
MSSGLVEPLPRSLRRGLRALVMELTVWGRTRRFPATISVGTPGGPRRSWTDDGTAADLGLRTEVVAALLARSLPPESTPSPAPACWLTRPGAITWHDLDAAWLAAARAAYAEAGVPLTFVVVTKTAWWDPRSGLAQQWRRPRRR